MSHDKVLARRAQAPIRRLDGAIRGAGTACQSAKALLVGSLLPGALSETSRNATILIIIPDRTSARWMAEPSQQTAKRRCFAAVATLRHTLLSGCAVLPCDLASGTRLAQERESTTLAAGLASNCIR